jgi:upstream activation factor subunit UAF30
MKPVNISDELRKFINLSEEEKTEPITRVLITQKLCQYIKENNLQKPEDKREILPDADMKKLFDITTDETEKLTYYSMQKKIQAHIFKI